MEGSTDTALSRANSTQISFGGAKREYHQTVLGSHTVSTSTEARITTTQEQSKQSTCKRAKWPERKLFAEMRRFMW